MTAALGTGRVRAAALVKTAVPKAVYDPVSRILKVEPAGGLRGLALAALLPSAAQAPPIPAAEELGADCRIFGAEVIRVYDIGVSGIHRLSVKSCDIMAAVPMPLLVAG